MPPAQSELLEQFSGRPAVAELVVDADALRAGQAVADEGHVRAAPEHLASADLEGEAARVVDHRRAIASAALGPADVTTGHIYSISGMTG